MLFKNSSAIKLKVKGKINTNWGGVRPNKNIKLSELGKLSQIGEFPHGFVR